MTVSMSSVRKMAWALAVVACSGLACKSAERVGEPPVVGLGRANLECPAQLLLPQPTLTYTLNCTGFDPEAQKIHAHGQVTFISNCDDKVFVTFSNPSTLFASGADQIVLEHRGDQKTETVQGNSDCHMMCFGTKECPPTDDMDSKTGSIDVHTSTPDPKLQSP